MTAKKFKFVSPGVFIDEIDNTRRTNIGGDIGPVVIGRLQRGPAMRPVQVDSFSEFVDIFGEPVPGGQGGDVWREGNKTAPTYAAYAAQAWLRNNQPLNVVRLLGVQNSKAAANSTGQAGWDMGANAKTKTVGTNNGAYGLFLFDSWSNPHTSLTAGHSTGSLAAVWYLNDQTSIELSGTVPHSGSTVFTGSAIFINTGSNGSDEFTVLIRSGSVLHADVGEKVTFNFNRNSERYIRNVFNTNPTLVNDTITTSTKGYFLGETFDQNREELFASGLTSQGIILGLDSRDDGANKWGNNLIGMVDSNGVTHGGTGWFISQDLGATAVYQPENMQKLFRLKGLDGGEWLQNNLKVSIQDLKPATNKQDPYGSFTVAIRKLDDTDNAPQFVEIFSNCTLNPNSPTYVARKIGNQFRTWDDDERRWKRFGAYPNMSKFVYVDMNVDVDRGATDPTFIPVGVFGHKRPKSVKSFSGSAEQGAGNLPGGQYGHIRSAAMDNTTHHDASKIFAQGAADGILMSGAIDYHAEVWYQPFWALFPTGSPDGGSGKWFTGSIFFPKVSLRHHGIQGGLSSPRQAYWGADTNRSGTTEYDASVKDVLRLLPNALNPDSDSTYTEDAWVFTLEDLSGSDTGHGAHYISGSRTAGTSITANSDGSGSLSTLLETKRFNRFTTVFAHGFDGLDITEKEPFRNSLLEGKTEASNYAFYTVHRAIDALKDPEAVEYNLATMPGLTDSALTAHLMLTCENRGDALAIIDIKNDHVADSEGTAAESARRGDVDQAVTTMKNRNLNTSYGCAYYPWVQVRDSLSNAILWMPPSVVALGVMSFSEAERALWFAPAGFTRGGLTMGASGLNVVGVRQHLTSQDRDRLYSANVNPIASFPAEGIVIFGQKTLQVTPSALDRINVRRLLIHTKKQISRIAALTLFEQNVRSTWNKFSSQVETFLNDIKAGFGLTDFKVVLDESTTTPEMVDRNILYAKVFLKPARAIEFIALDFIITDTGAAFDD